MWEIAKFDQNGLLVQTHLQWRQRNRSKEVQVLEARVPKIQMIVFHEFLLVVDAIQSAEFTYLVLFELKEMAFRRNRRWCGDCRC
jgi:hypothetical protein